MFSPLLFLFILHVTDIALLWSSVLFLSRLGEMREEAHASRNTSFRRGRMTRRNPEKERISFTFAEFCLCYLPVLRDSAWKRKLVKRTPLKNKKTRQFSVFFFFSNTWCTSVFLSIIYPPACCTADRPAAKRVYPP